MGGGSSLEVNDGGLRSETMPGVFQADFIGERARKRLAF